MGRNSVVLSEAKELAIQDLIREIEKQQSIICSESRNFLTKWVR